MNKTLISIEELKQIALREIHTYPGCEDVSAVGIYPVTDEVAERNFGAWFESLGGTEGGFPFGYRALSLMERK